jgi:hypothetical protein
MHYLGNAFWLNEQDRAAHDTGKATVSEGARRPKHHEQDADV